MPVVPYLSLYQSVRTIFTIKKFTLMAATENIRDTYTFIKGYGKSQVLRNNIVSLVWEAIHLCGRCSPLTSRPSSLHYNKQIRLRINSRYVAGENGVAMPLQGLSWNKGHCASFHVRKNSLYYQKDFVAFCIIFVHLDDRMCTHLLHQLVPTIFVKRKVC